MHPKNGRNDRAGGKMPCCAENVISQKGIFGPKEHLRRDGVFGPGAIYSWSLPGHE